MSILCFIGLHRWNKVPVIKYDMNIVRAYADCNVCKNCGKHKRDPKRSTRELMQTITLELRK